MRYGIVLTIIAGTARKHIVQAFITDVSDDVKSENVTTALGESPYAPEFSEYGIFLANRKIVAETKLPKDAISENAKEIPWKALAGTESVQLNIRTTAGKRARWELAAAAAGYTGRNALGDFIRDTLDTRSADLLGGTA